VNLDEMPVYGGDIRVSGNLFENIEDAWALQTPYCGGALYLNTFRGTVSHNTFTQCNTGAIAIIMLNNTNPCSVLVTENTFLSNDTYNAHEGVHMASAIFIGTDVTGRCVLRGNSFIDNQKIALGLFYLDIDTPATLLDAEQNYWGDSTGPYHAELNPNGRGDTIAGRVDFDPWLLESGTEFEKHRSSSIPQTFALLDPYPNPFNPGVVLPLEVHRPGVFKIELYDVLGRRIWERTEHYSAGTYRIFWPGIDSNDRAVAAEIYFARASSGREVSPTRKLVLLK